MMISAVKTDLLPIVWPLLQDHIQMAIDHSNDEVTLDATYNKALNNDVLILTISEDNDIIATVVIKIECFVTGKKVLQVCYAGGERMSEWVEQLDNALNDIAKEQGCSEVYITGRQGWTKALKKLNYNTIYTTVSREVI